MVSTSYSEYLKSEVWLSKRRALVRSCDAKCFCCSAVHGPGKWLDLHHLTYERLGHELPEDIVLVCRSCHDLIHGYSKSAGTIREITLHVRGLMARKQQWLARPYAGPKTKPRKHFVIAPTPDPKIVPIHPGSFATKTMSQDRQVLEDGWKRAARQKQVAKHAWHFAHDASERTGAMVLYHSPKPKKKR